MENKNPSLEAASGKGNSGDIRYLQPIAIESGNKKKYCRFKKSNF